MRPASPVLSLVFLEALRITAKPSEYEAERVYKQDSVHLELYFLAFLFNRTARQTQFTSFIFLNYNTKDTNPVSSTCALPSPLPSPCWALLSSERLPQLAVAKLLPRAAPRTCRSTARTVNSSSRFPGTTTPTSPTDLSLATTGVMAT